MKSHADARARRLCAFFVVAASTGAVAPSAWARSARVVPYPFAAAWTTAVRFLRIDRGFPIREKDESAGYILFDYVDGAKKYKGSLELVRGHDETGRETTQAQLSLPDLPRHFETMLLDKLADKLRDERGDPAPPPQRPAPGDGDHRPSPDAGDGLPRPPTLPDLPRATHARGPGRARAIVAF